MEPSYSHSAVEGEGADEDGYREVDILEVSHGEEYPLAGSARYSVKPGPDRHKVGKGDLDRSLKNEVEEDIYIHVVEGRAESEHTETR